MATSVTKHLVKYRVSAALATEDLVKHMVFGHLRLVRAISLPANSTTQIQQLLYATRHSGVDIGLFDCHLNCRLLTHNLDKQPLASVS